MDPEPRGAELEPSEGEGVKQRSNSIDNLPRHRVVQFPSGPHPSDEHTCNHPHTLGEKNRLKLQQLQHAKHFTAVRNRPVYPQRLCPPVDTTWEAYGSCVLGNATETTAGSALSHGDVGRSRCGCNHGQPHHPRHCFYPWQTTDDPGFCRGNRHAVEVPPNHRPGTCVTLEVSNFCASICDVSGRKILNRTQMRLLNLNRPSQSQSPRMKTLRPPPTLVFAPLSTSAHSSRSSRQ